MMSRSAGLYLHRVSVAHVFTVTVLLQAYRSSFSMRSTWVSIMRRQQYLFSPSLSIASLKYHMSV